MVIDIFYGLFIADEMENVKISDKTLGGIGILN